MIKGLDWKRVKRRGLTFLLVLSLFVTSIPQPTVYANVASESSGIETLPDPSTLQVVSPPVSSPGASTDPASPQLPEALDVLLDKTRTTQISASIRSRPSIRRLSRDSYGGNEKVSIKVDNGTQEPVEVSIENALGETLNLEITTSELSDTKSFLIQPPTNLRPGKYTVVLRDAQGNTSEQNFYWGVLALNMNKATYRPGERVHFFMAVLDDLGKMVCDANVELKVINPDGQESILSTGNSQIKINPECNTKEVTKIPDYEAEMTASKMGEYALILSATTQSGTHTITDGFGVLESIPFDIERMGPTRIYPLNQYPVEIAITPTEDFEGKIYEVVPDEFSITQHPDLSGGYTGVSNKSERDNIDGEAVLGTSVALALPHKGSQTLTQGFGGRHPDPLIQAKYEAYGVVGHDGADFAMPVGTPVYAVDSGKVVLSSENADYGTTIVIEHSWGKSYYGHLSELLVDKDAQVKRGDQIAMSGNTGLSTGPHLHFGIKLGINNTTNGYYGKADPLPLLGLSQFPTVLGASTLSVTPQVKVIEWDVILKKGERKVLGYMFDAPDISPQFYTTGPLKIQDKSNNLIFEEARRWQIASDDTSSSEVDPNADNGAQAWTCTAGSDGNCGTGHYTVVDDGSGSPSTSGYISLDTATGTTGETDAWDMTTFTPTGLLSVTSVTVYIYAQSATNANGGTLDDVQLSTYMGGAYQTNVAVTPTFGAWAWYSATFNGSWTQSDLDSLRIRVVRTRQGGGSPGSQDDDVQIATSYASVTYNYATYEKLTLDGYTFENDDEDQATGDANDDNTVLAGSGFSSGKNLTSVKRGERVTLRLHVKNTGAALPSTSNLALFYDRNDGLWTKAEASTSAVIASSPGNCTSTDWYCNSLPSSTYTSSAVDPYGNLWYVYQDASFNLAVAVYVGTGGDCGNGAFNCSVIDDHATNSLGYDSEIAFDKAGNPWISYGDTTVDSLKVAHFVGGRSGTGCGASGSLDWTCETVEDVANQVAQVKNPISINPSTGKAWVTYQDFTNSSLKVAQYVGGAAGSGCTDTDWTCTTIQDTGNSLASELDITFESTSSARIAFRNDTNGSVQMAEYVGTGGNACSSAAWTCTTVDDVSDSVGAGMSIGVAADGKPIIAHFNTTTDALKVAKYVGDGSGDCTSNQWDCTTIEGMANLTAASSSVTHAPDGNLWIGYRDQDDTSISIARYVGGAAGSGCDDTNWTCTSIDSSDNFSSDIFLSFDTSGNGWLTYRKASLSTVKYARLIRGGDQYATAGLSGTGGDSITKSHADMTSASDTTGRGDSDCVTATTWNNGKWFESEEGTGVSLPNGTSTSQCTEVAFTIDTSKAVEGRTYRFTLASNNTFGPEATEWRGIQSYSTSTLPTITIASSSVSRYSKDVNPIFANCTDTNWGCVTVDATNTLGDFWLALTIDPSGTPWINYYEDTTSDALHVATYVGSGGNCDATGGSDAWQCTTVDNSAAIIGANGSITHDQKGHIWVSYRDSTNGDMKVAVNYDHPDMSACTASGWDCVIVDGTSASMGFESAIMIDPGGNPWVTYRDGTNTDLRYARLVGSGGNCTSTAWECGDIDDTGGEDTSLAFDGNGKAWVSYYNTGSTELRVAEYVGTGGNCSGGDSWNCVAVDTISASVGNYTGIRIDYLGIPWVVYHDNGTDGVKIATKQNHAGMSACSATGWDCTEIDTLPSAGADPSLAFNENNEPLVVYYTDNTMRWAEYVGGGTGNCTDTNWQCTTLDSQVADTGEYSHNGLKYDHSGVPWTVYKDVTNANVKVAKLHMPDYISDYRYTLSSGKAPATDADGTCNSTTDNKGYCGVYANDSNYDSVAAGVSQRPMYSFAERFSTNSTAPTAQWLGRTDRAPSTGGTTGDLILQVYRFGSTNAWENLDTDTASADCNTIDCELTGTAGGTASEYYKADGSNYWVYYRLWQYEHSTSETLKTNCFDGGNGDCAEGGAATPTLDQLMRGGKWFNSSGTRQPFAF